ncbi:MAG: trigger factor [Microscillaceae bacterium]
MNIALEQKSPTEALIKVTLNKSDYQPEVEKKIREYSKKVQMKGFRPGKVPPSLIKKMYGREILIEGVQNKVQKELSEYLSKEDIRFLGGPLPDYEASSKLEEEPEDELVFAYRLGLLPTFSLPEVDLGVEFFEIVMDEEKFENHLATILEDYNTIIEVNQAEAGDFLEGVLKPEEDPASSQEEAETTDWKTYFPINNLVLPLRQVSEAQQSLFLGAKVGDTRVFSLHEIFDEPEDQIRYLTGLNNEIVSQIEGNFVLEVQKITRSISPEISLELLTTAYPSIEADTLEEFKEKIKVEILKYQQKTVDETQKEQLKEALLAKIDLELPHEFLKEWIALSRRNELSPEEIEQKYLEEQQELVWSVIVNEVKKQQNISVSQEEVIEEAYGLLSRYSQGQEGEERLRQLSELTYKFLNMNDGKQYQVIEEKLIESKALAFLMQFYLERAASVQSITFEEYFQKMNGEEEAETEEFVDAEEMKASDENQETERQEA